MTDGIFLACKRIVYTLKAKKCQINMFMFRRIYQQSAEIKLLAVSNYVPWKGIYK